jgi:BirA family biotin operon repressor/biotin-[acetyl-CoA-carboxylase] ligase
MHRPLTAADLLPHGPLTRLGRQLFVHDTLGSTNTFLLDNAATAGDGAVAWAEFQTAGRGRLGRQWQAPRGSSVILSVLLIEPVGSALPTRATMLAALAACEAIEAATDCAPAVRWPNDIVLGGHKLGGVLAESRPLAAPSGAVVQTAQRAVVIGIGINCLQQPGHFAGELAGKATSLECAVAHAVNRAPVAAGVLARLDHWLAAGARDAAGWQRISEQWRARCADLGSRVTLEHDGRRFSGTVLEITGDGDLVVELEQGGRRRFASANTTRAW